MEAKPNDGILLSCINIVFESLHELNSLLKPYYDKLILEAGCDEAGRGCLAGPVFAAAVILPKQFHNPLINDSKKLSEKNRKILKNIIEKDAQAWAVAKIYPREIDDINILKASFKAMEIAIKSLHICPESLLIDGNQFSSSLDIPYRCIVKGDAKYASIAAASILAKTHRDEYMVQLHNDFPQYGWKTNKGYPTLAHRKAVLAFGRSVHHRKTFQVSIQSRLFK